MAATRWFSLDNGPCKMNKVVKAVNKSIALTLTTPYGDRYTIHANGNIGRTDIPDFQPSDQWKMLGIRPVTGGALIPLHKITAEWLATHPLLYKNGKPRYTVCHIDHGTYGEWGNTQYHGVKTVAVE